MNWTRIVVPALALVIGAGGAVAGFTLAGGHGPNTSYTSNSQGSGLGAGAMGAGGGMMGGGSDIARGAPGGLVPASRMESLATQAAHSVDREGQTLFYRSEHVTLVALGAPGSRPGMYWQIDGIDGPTVSVAAGATITVNFADGDPGRPHGFELTTAAPPYPRMAMMAGDVAANGAFIMPVPAPEGSLWYAATISFTAPSPWQLLHHLPCARPRPTGYVGQVHRPLRPGAHEDVPRPKVEAGRHNGSAKDRDPYG